MSYRRNAWNRPTWRKVGAAAAAAASGSPAALSIDALMQSGIWYPAGLRDTSDLALGQGAFGAAQGFSFAVPQSFAVDGTLTKIGGHVAGPGTASIWYAVYSAKATDKTKPDARLADVLVTKTGSGGHHGETATSIAIKQGDILWFVTTPNDQCCTNGGPLIYNTNRLYSLLGSAYGANENFPVPAAELKLQVGYKAGPGGAAQPFNEPPATWTDFTKLNADFGIFPCVMFQFTPS